MIKKICKTLVVGVVGIFIGMGLNSSDKISTSVAAKSDEKIQITKIDEFDGKTIIEFSDESYALYNPREEVFLFQQFNLGDWSVDLENSLELEKVILTYLGIDEIQERENIDTVEELTLIAQEWLKKEFNLTLDIPIKIGELEDGINARITYGKNIVFSEKFLKKHDSQFIKKVIIHELCHYVANKQGLQFGDGELDFERMLGAYGSTSNYSISELEVLLGEKIVYKKAN